MTGKDNLSEKDLLEQAATIKRFFEYLPLGSELKMETDIAKKTTKKQQYQGLDTRFLVIMKIIKKLILKHCRRKIS